MGKMGVVGAVQSKAHPSTHAEKGTKHRQQEQTHFKKKKWILGVNYRIADKAHSLKLNHFSS